MEIVENIHPNNSQYIVITIVLKKMNLASAMHESEIILKTMVRHRIQSESQYMSAKDKN